MEQTIPALNYFENDMQPQELPVLDEGFDLYDDPAFASHSAMGHWDAFMSRYANNNGSCHG